MARRASRSPGTIGAALLLAVLVALPVHAANNGQGNGSFRVKPFAEMQTNDSSIATLTASPTSQDPGPRAWDDVDRLQFNSRFTNGRHVVMLEVTSATDGSASSTATVQGVVHSIADWVHARTDQTARYATVRTTGTSDPSAGDYTPPGGFTQDGQGEVTIRTYDPATPEDGGTPTTVSWIYDSGQDLYWFDSADKDFTNGNGEVEVSPASQRAKQTYVFTAAGIMYAVLAVGDAGSGFIPTIAQAWDKQPGAAGGNDFDAFVLLDFPSGTPKDDFQVTLQATVQTTK